MILQLTNTQHIVTIEKEKNVNQKATEMQEDI